MSSLLKYLPALLLAGIGTAAPAAETIDAAALYVERCGQCHLAAEQPFPAPPAHAVQSRYRRAYPERAAFVAAVSAWLAAPDPAAALMREAVAHHGAMQPVALSADERDALANYLYTAEFAVPAAYGAAHHGGQHAHAHGAHDSSGGGKGHGGGCRGDGGGGGHGHGAGDSSGGGKGHGGGCRGDGGGGGHGHGAGDGSGGGKGHGGGCRGDGGGGGHGHGAGDGSGGGKGHGGGCRGDGDTAATPLARGAALVAPFKRALMGALSGALAEGPVGAIDVCRVTAPALADASSDATVRVGRASDRLRNPDNAAPPWVAPLLAAYVDGSRVREPASVSLGNGRHGYVEPIGVKPMCLGCHGSELSPEVAARLDARYPSDAARGYAVGDLRGVFWVEFAD
ncbi:MAG: DUF3365 domain-containing protein [Gammaproteobacteria bacterium]